MKATSEKLLEKAVRAIRAAEILLREGDLDSAAGRSYYAMFYVAEALLFEKGLQFRKHSGVHSAFGEHFAKSGLLDSKFHRWLLNASNLRAPRKAPSSRNPQLRRFEGAPGSVSVGGDW